MFIEQMWNLCVNQKENPHLIISITQLHKMPPGTCQLHTAMTLLHTKWTLPAFTTKLTSMFNVLYYVCKISLLLVDVKLSSILLKWQHLAAKRSLI